jgi:hypothetical protein
MIARAMVRPQKIALKIISANSETKFDADRPLCTDTTLYPSSPPRRETLAVP